MSKITAENVLKTLNDVIADACDHISEFSKNPGKDFSRKRKLPPTELIRFLVSMEGNSINAELFKAYPDKDKRMTASALDQQRSKLKSEFLQFLLRKYVETLDRENIKTLNGYRLFAIDGSDFNTPPNPESENYLNTGVLNKDGSE